MIFLTDGWNFMYAFWLTIIGLVMFIVQFQTHAACEIPRRVLLWYRCIDSTYLQDNTIMTARLSSEIFKEAPPLDPMDRHIFFLIYIFVMAIMTCSLKLHFFTRHVANKSIHYTLFLNSMKNASSEYVDQNKQQLTTDFDTMITRHRHSRGGGNTLPRAYVLLKLGYLLLSIVHVVILPKSPHSAFPHHITCYRDGNIGRCVMKLNNSYADITSWFLWTAALIILVINAQSFMKSVWWYFSDREKDKNCLGYLEDDRLRPMYVEEFIGNDGLILIMFMNQEIDITPIVRESFRRFCQAQAL